MREVYQNDEDANVVDDTLEASVREGATRMECIWERERLALTATASRHRSDPSRYTLHSFRSHYRS